MKFRILTLCLFLSFNLTAQEEQLTPQQKAMQQMQQVFSSGMQDSIFNHVPDSLTQQMQKMYGIDIKEMMKKGMSEASEPMDETSAEQLKNSLQQYMPSSEEEAAGLLKEMMEGGLGKMLLDSMTKNALVTPKSGSHYDDFMLAKEGKIEYTNEGLYNFALDKKELMLSEIKEFHKTRKEVVEGSKRIDMSGPEFNTFVEIPADYDYDKIEYDEDAITIEEQLEKVKNGEDEELVVDGLSELMAKQARNQVAPFIGSMKARAINWEQVQAVLPPKSAAIEFIRIKTSTEAEGRNIYAAAVLRSDLDKPQKVILGSAEKLRKLLTVNSKTNPDTLYKRGGIPLGKSIASGKALYDLVWARVDSLLQGVEIVYYVPDGLLHELAFAAMQDQNKVYLSNKYELHQLGTTRTLITGVEKIYPPKDKCWLLAGGLSYYKVPHLPSKSKSTDCAIVMDSIALSFNAPPPTKRKINLPELPGTQKEIDVLAGMLEKQGIEFQKFTGVKAPEEYFRRLGAYFANPGVLHIGTHGFYIPEVEQPKMTNTKSKNKGNGSSRKLKQTRYKKPNSELGQCGLYLSGAGNKNFNGYSYIHTDNGHWTAQDIAGQSLLGTKLVVLSACNSGRGNAQISSGIFGLQGAFKIAGVDKMIVSLWEISDVGTAVFMETFYAHWLSEKTVYQAFKATQLDMQKHSEYNTPYYWAGFVLLE